MAGLQDRESRKLVIVGGGTAGWIVAASLARHLGQERYEITVVESSHISKIGGGESVLPSFLRLIADIGLDEEVFIKKTGATLKLGTRFEDWLETGHSFFHQIGTLGCDLEEADFFHCWLKARQQGDATPLSDYAPAAVLASHATPECTLQWPSESLLGPNHSLHIDSSRVREYLAGYAEERGVNRITAHVVRVNVSESGSIESLELNNRQKLEGDFYVDCSGFRGLLIDEALESPYQDWGHFLPCDRAVSVQSANNGKWMPFTSSRARESGWTWHIPLEKHSSNGYVFSSGHCSDSRAMKTLLEGVNGKLLNEPVLIPIRPGVREQFWMKNCVAVGLAGGILEPLESATIHLAIQGVRHLLQLFPDLFQDAQEWQVLATEYNILMRGEYEEIRDFIVLHYCSTRRVDAEFWLRCQSNPIPDSLAEKIELFKARGEIRLNGNDLFQKSNWQAVFSGMGIIPRAYHPFLDTADFNAVQESMRNYQSQLELSARSLFCGRA